MADDEPMDDLPTDELSRLLSDLAAKLGEVAEVDRETLQDGAGVVVNVTPRNPLALAMSWIVMKDEIVFQTGDRGGCWELARTLDDVDWMARVANAVARGRVRETFGPKRSWVEVTLEDGTTETMTGYTGGLLSLLPTPGWKRRGRTVEYASYFDSRA